MRQRPIARFRPDLERFEAKQPLSAGAATATRRRRPSGRLGAPAAAAARPAPATRRTAGTGYLVYRLTNPTVHHDHLIPPFRHVLVQHAQPVPGQVYNMLYVAVKNGTAQTFNASSGFTVRLPGFTGTQARDRQRVPDPDGGRAVEAESRIIFYVLTKKYYPLSPQVAGRLPAPGSAAGRRRSSRDRRGSSSGSSTTRPRSPGPSTGS